MKAAASGKLYIATKANCVAYWRTRTMAQQNSAGIAETFAKELQVSIERPHQQQQPADNART
jgi:hypothetical protein